MLFFDCTNFLIEKHQKNQRNGHNFSKIVKSLLKLGMILAFTLTYPINISLKNIFEHIKRKKSL